MTVTATDLLLEASGISKTYGAVVALRDASLAVRPGEVHALMGANGAGKSTLVKILTGAVRPDTGTISVRGHERSVHSPGEARRGGLVSVYQEPALIPDLDIRSNLRLTRHPARALPALAGRARPAEPRPVEHRPARAAGVAPDRRPRPRPRDRARRPHARRDDRGPAGQPDRAGPRGRRPAARRRALGHLHLPPDDRDRRGLRPGDGPPRGRDGRRRRRDDRLRGPDRRADARPGRREPRPAAAPIGPRRRRGAPRTSMPRVSARAISAGTKLQDATFDLYPGEVLGVVALEGQGQDELFDVLSGSVRPSGGDLLDRRRGGLVPASGGRDPGRPRLRRGGPRRGAPDAALGAREHRAAARRRGSGTGA